MEYVIIGNGVAGTSAAESIRQFDQAGNIAMIADENNVLYCRPMISLVLEGSIAPDKIKIRPENFYEDLKIETMFGNRVEQIDVANKTLTIKNEQAVPFDKLLIASGADPRPIKATGLDLKNIFYMRTAGHVQQMLEILPKVKNGLVLGGGLVGFKAAYGLLRRGLKVTMLIRSGYPLAMQVDEVAGKIILDELIARGLEVKLEVEVVAFEGKESVEQAHLSDGSVLPCDMVVIGKGVLPALSFVPQDKIEVDLGVRINANMETSTAGIFAAGDVAESVDIGRQTPWVNAIWPEAAVQGRIAGINMAGRRVAYKGSLSRNVIRIFDLDIMTGGLVNPPKDSHYEVIQATIPRKKMYRKLVFRGDKLVGFAMVNAIEQGGILISLIHNEIPINIARTRLMETSFNFKQLMKS
ncbi:MAG: NAD(P)/FAD-dependent oxidoreductase [Deltaproteobacteria bacterium]|nr:NAD(P)/FAD-dependent oxidoreductase [Deltaproteobacteria bacterium]